MNWTSLIKDILNSGMTQEQIAAACDTSQSNIWYLLNIPSRCPSWELGQRISKLHTARCSVQEG